MSSSNQKEDGPQQYLFVVEYYDPLPMTKKKYLLKYFIDSHSVEMVDIQKKKLFLKKSPCPPEVSISDFAVGSKVFLYSRELSIIDYGDGTTRQQLHRQASKSVAILSADIYESWGKIITALESEMTLVKIRTVLLAENDAESLLHSFYQKNDNNKKNDKNKDIMSLTRGTNLVVIFQAENGCQLMKDLITTQMISENSHGVFIAPTSSQVVEIISPSSKDGETVDILNTKSTATLDSCTCCVIRPHAVKEGHVGDIIQQIISQGYEVSAMDSFQFDKVASEEFLEVYKGVVPEYPEHVVQLCSGLSVCMEIRAENAVEVFRETAGPWDIDMAKALRPDSLRAKYGHDKIRSAVHCTDVPHDAQLECEYCFEIMQ